MSETPRKKKIPTPEKLQAAGIGISLYNYLYFIGVGSCKEDCPIFVLCEGMRTKIEDLGSFPQTRGLWFVWSCPLLVYEIEKE